MNALFFNATCVALSGAGILVTACNTGTAQDLQTALKRITDTAAQICQTAPLEQTSTGAKLTADAQAKLGGIVGQVADIGFQGAGEIQKSGSTGILQADLEKAIESSNNCKLEVFRTLSKELLGSYTAPQNPIVTRGSSPISYPTPNWCFKARTQIEFAICNDRDLAELDLKQESQYFQTLNSLSGARHTLLVQDQRNWISNMNKRCSLNNDALTKKCIESMMLTRLTDLDTY